ncbi:bromodomain-containing factor 1 [Nematocida displodere]|uniref:Bromodomain-containing factor 1 n=1 Tax=Nematocida displodere TaxID=1805483 RepID=A0A177EGN5_9MICR|nr:bromodomain-containing factor 1 [Nematocida displodere]
MQGAVMPTDTVEHRETEENKEDFKESASLCKELLLKLKKSSFAAPFLYPVDPQRLNIPDYHEKIKKPMDLSTITKKLDTETYAAVEEFTDDINLMLSNCYLYNNQVSAVYKMGCSLEKYYKQLLQKGALERKRKQNEDSEKKRPKSKTMPDDEISKCTEALNELTKTKHRRINWPFLEPVDGTLVPNYYVLINSPMDLQTMRGKLTSRQYKTQKEFADDFDLMIKNCYLFNAEGSEVYMCATKLNALFKQTLDQKKKPADDTLARIAEIKALIAQYEAELKHLEKKAGVQVTGFGYEEKKRLKRRIESLSADKLGSVIQYIQQNVPSAVVNELEELEINLDHLDHTVLSKISDIVRDAYVEEQNLESDSSSD